MVEFTYLILFLLIVIIFFFFISVVRFIKESIDEYPNLIAFFSQNKRIAVTLILLILGIFYLVNLLFNIFVGY